MCSFKLCYTKYAKHRIYEFIEVCKKYVKNRLVK